MSKSSIEIAWEAYTKTLEPVAIAQGVMAATVKAITSLPENLRAGMHTTFEAAREVYNAALDNESKAHDQYRNAAAQPDLFTGKDGTLTTPEGTVFDLTEWKVTGGDVVDAARGRVRSHPQVFVLELAHVSNPRGEAEVWAYVGETGAAWPTTRTRPDPKVVPMGGKKTRRRKAAGGRKAKGVASTSARVQ